jgi:protein-disulfide isomerase
LAVFWEVGGGWTARRAIAVPSRVGFVIAVAASIVASLVLTVMPSEAEAPPAESGMSVAAVPRSSDPDRPTRTSSGRVHPNSDPRLPPALGPYPAKVVVVVSSDFQCPVCARVTDATHQIAEEWPGEVRVEFHQHPLAMHANAEHAAVASLAAHRQGKFWGMHDVLFAHQHALDQDSLVVYAREVGLDVSRFRRDYRDPALRARAQREGALAERLGASGTPGFFINGHVQVGWGSWQGFRAQVQHELEQVNDLLAKGTKLAAVHALRAQALAKDAAAFAAYKEAMIGDSVANGSTKVNVR